MVGVKRQIFEHNPQCPKCGERNFVFKTYLNQNIHQIDHIIKNPDEWIDLQCKCGYNWKMDVFRKER